MDQPLLLLREETVLWPTAAEKIGNWHRGIVRRGGPLHDEMAQGRGGKNLATPDSRGRQHQQPRQTRGIRRGDQPYLD